MRYITDISIEEAGTMCNQFFDYNDGDFAMSISDSMAMDSDGDLMCAWEITWQWIWTPAIFT